MSDNVKYDDVVYCGVDEWSRPVFHRKDSKGLSEYYCTIDYLVGGKLDIDAVIVEGLHYKGRHFQGEPHYKVYNVWPVLPSNYYLSEYGKQYYGK